MTEIISTSAGDALQRAVEVLRSGGLVAFPTDTVYGLGGVAFNGHAVESIYEAKNRPEEKAIPVLIGEVEDLGKVAAEMTGIAQRLAERFWPGPLTLVVKQHPGLPAGISANATIGVRIPDHALARRLLRMAGPLAVSSANLSGYPSPRTAQEVFEQLDGRIAMILDGGRTSGGIPSTVVDCLTSVPRIIRVGPISEEDILAALNMKQ